MLSNATLRDLDASEQHEIGEDQWAASCDHLAREYLRADGTYGPFSRTGIDYTTSLSNAYDLQMRTTS